jgi:hypothetical protein
MFGGLMKSYRSRQAAPSADRFSGGLPVPAIHIDLSDGFDHDDVVLHVGVPAASAQKFTLRESAHL